MARRMKTYAATFERDESGYWTVVARVAPGQIAISDGQTLAKARKRIRQAIGALLDVKESSFTIEERIKLPAETQRSLRHYERAVAELEQHERVTRAARRTAATALTRAGISRRDAGQILGISGQRVQQVLEERP
jgi:predicted RNase H-like HicB family nuclease